MAYLAAVFIGYLLGCSNMALYISRSKGVDLRSGGSKNLGASNAVTMMGWSAGILTALHDMGKTVLALFLAKFLFPGAAYIGVAAGVASVFGHIFPFYLKFRGGKGFACYVGLLLALNWKFGLIMMVVVAIATLVTDFIVVGTTVTVAASPVFLGLTMGWVTALILAVASVVILWKHRENYIRMYNGTELGLSNKRHGLFRK